MKPKPSKQVTGRRAGWDSEGIVGDTFHSSSAGHHSHHTSKKDREDAGSNQISGSQALLRHWKCMVNFWDIAKDIRPSGKSGNLYSAVRGQQTHRTWQWQPRLGSPNLPRLSVFHSKQFLGPSHWLHFLTPLFQGSQRLGCKASQGHGQSMFSEKGILEGRL